jgi:hypothetical protein
VIACPEGALRIFGAIRSGGPHAAIPNAYAACLRDPTGDKLVAWCVQDS